MGSDDLKNPPNVPIVLPTAALIASPSTTGSVATPETPIFKFSFACSFGVTMSSFFLSELLKIKSALNKLHESCCGGPENAQHCSILQALEAGDV